LILGFGFFVSDIISGIVSGLFGRPISSGPRPKLLMVVFRSSFYWKLG